ncbi:MAG: hypothetical protein ACF788_10560, partial [Novipirellula sp. JB048]
MTQLDTQIAELVKRFASDDFQPSTDLPLSVALVKSVVERHNLPAHRFGPNAQIAGGEWSDDDFEEIVSEWICYLLAI